LKPNLSPKSTRIEPSNNTFAERKCCQVFVYEAETFHRRRPNGISHCENVEQKSPKPPFPLHNVDLHVIQQCLGPLYAPPQTAAPTVKALSPTYAVKSPLVTMARPKFAPESIPSRGPIPKLHYLPHPWTRPMTYDTKRHPDPICRFSTMHLTDRPTDRPTDRSRQNLMTIARFAPDESDAA